VFFLLPACCGQSGTVAMRSMTAKHWAAPQLGLCALGCRNGERVRRGGGGLDESGDAGTTKRQSRGRAR
jgi:hypothetical protein